MKSSLLPVVVALVLGLFAPRPMAAQNTQAVEQAVKAVAAEQKRAFAAHDLDACLVVYDTQPGGLLIWGGKVHTLQSMRARIQEVWTERTTETWTHDRSHVIVLSDTAALLQITWSGRYTRTNGQTWEFKSTSFSTWLPQKRGNAWKIVAEHGSATGTQVKN